MRYTDTDLALYADGRLSPQRKQRLSGIAEGNPSLADTLAALEASRLPYKAAFDHQPLPKVPEKLRQTVHDWSCVTRDSGEADILNADTETQWAVPIARAACLIVAIVIGYTTGGRWSEQEFFNKKTAIDAPVNEQLNWVHRVVNYQSLYVERTTDGLEVDWAATNETIERLRGSTGLTAALPDLTDAGYRFRRIQELGFDGKPVIQLIYTKAGHVPLALCFMPARKKAEVDSRLRVAKYANLTAADWIQNGQRFVLVADEAPDTLRSLYKDIAPRFMEAL